MRVIKAGLRYDVVDRHGETVVATCWDEGVANQIAKLLPDPSDVAVPIKLTLDPQDGIQDALRASKMEGFDLGFRFAQNRLTKLKPLMLERLKLCRNFLWTALQEKGFRSTSSATVAAELLSAVSDVVMIAELKADPDDQL